MVVVVVAAEFLKASCTRENFSIKITVHFYCNLANPPKITVIPMMKCFEIFLERSFIKIIISTLFFFKKSLDIWIFF